MPLLSIAVNDSGTHPRPGEISLAHHGVLFLDELPEFDRKVLEVLREPLETGEIHIARVAQHVTFPAQFQLIAAMNPCPCGYLGHPKKMCRCTPNAIARYQNKISGPLLDRIDLVIELPAISAHDLQQPQPNENSMTVRQRVIQARQHQIDRQGKVNARLSNTELDDLANIQPQARIVLAKTLDQLSLSARSYHRLMRIARTIADLNHDKEVTQQHIMRAISFRRALFSNQSYMR